jgi:hypothetical protein
MTKKLYLVETISMFRQRYVVESKDEEDALDEVAMNVSGYKDDWQEFSQKHLDEVITSSREISKEEYLELYNKDNDYSTVWSDDMKFRYINKIDYKD